MRNFSMRRRVTRWKRYQCDVLIVGAGVIGLSLAWQLGRRGARVIVYDAGRDGRATRAAAGMLAPLAEARSYSPFVHLGRDSLARYPSFLEELREASGADISLCGPGMLRVALTDAEAEQQEKALGWQEKMGLPLHRLTGDEARRLEPALGPEVVSAILSPEEKHVPPRALLAALKTACSRNNVLIKLKTENAGNGTNGNHFDTFFTRDAQGIEAQISFKNVVIASGAWSGDWSWDIGKQVKPLRGQALSLTQEGSAPPVTHTVYSSAGYVVPRPDGQTVLGATEEDVEFDASTTREGLASLRAMGARLVPALSDWKTHESWAGLRPVSTDGLPLIGQYSHFDNLYMASGHGRNGILLAPRTADIMVACLLDDEDAPAAFSPTRFKAQA